MILCVRPKKEIKIFQLLVTDYLQFAEQQTLNMTLARKYSKYNVPQQFVEMLLQNKPWLVRYKKIRAMSSSPSVECDKLKNRSEHFIFVANRNTKITQNCTIINSNGRLQGDQWSSSQAATQANILIKFKILQ